MAGTTSLATTTYIATLILKISVQKCFDYRKTMQYFISFTLTIEVIFEFSYKKDMNFTHSYS